ncbi:MAG TPA: PIN domain-containing protein [bacterium]|nr:PIN domain-containing protein [bacterium]
MRKQFLDTNVLVYAIDADSQFYEQSRSVLLDSDGKICPSSKNLTEFLAVVARVGERPLTLPEALHAVQSFLCLCSVLYPTPKSARILYELLQKHQITGLAIHDVEIASIALAHEISELLTFNTDDFGFIETLECHPPVL